MSRGGSGGRQRVRTARGRSAQSTRWLERQLNDPYVRRAKAEGYRSRAAYKLLELDERFHLLRGTKRIIDLGIAPGGWSEVVRKKRPDSVVVGIDLLPVDPIEGVAILQMDFMAERAPELLTEALDSGAARMHGVAAAVDARRLGAPLAQELSAYLRGSNRPRWPAC